MELHKKWCKTERAGEKNVKEKHSKMKTLKNSSECKDINIILRFIVTETTIKLRGSA